MIDTARKALAPGVLGLIAVLAQWVASGAWDAPEVATAIGTLATSLVVYAVPNAGTTNGSTDPDRVYRQP